MSVRMRVTTLGSMVALLVVGCGGDDATSSTDAGSQARTVEIEMVDIAFEPEAVEVDAGETVRFVFRNAGEVAHDAFIGDAEAQEEHEAEMAEAHGGHGDEAEDALTLEPGASGELVYSFDEAGEMLIGCHQPGHYEGGMRVAIDVT